MTPEPIDIYPYGERRLGLRLLRYWQEKRGLRVLPIENDIDPEELGQDWDYCFLLQSRDVANIEDYNFTYLGNKIMKAYFDKRIDEHNQFMVGPNAFRLSKHFTQVLDTKQPVLDEGEFETLHGRRVLYRQVLLPLGDLDKGIEAIFGGMNYKIVE
ncbi:MAG: PAS domain-containing protein [Rickettsiales bacterium]|nr:PAS domain-containing protein [Rickettsiales bacterium]